MKKNRITILSAAFIIFNIVMLSASLIVYKFVPIKLKSNIVLSDFTKEFISLYMNELDDYYRRVRDEKVEIIISTYTDTSNYYLEIFFNDLKMYKCWRDDFVGKTSYLWKRVMVYGDMESVFYTVKKELKPQKPCRKVEYLEYDPPTWTIALNKDLSFCKMRTYKTRIDDDISSIQNLAAKYFKIPETIHEDNYIYGREWGAEVGAQFPFYEDHLRRYISSNFKVKKELNYIFRIAVVVSIMIDKNGNAMLVGIARSSDDAEVDAEALRIAEEICKYKFVPATHRGEIVNSYSSIIFFKEDITP